MHRRAVIARSCALAAGLAVAGTVGLLAGRVAPARAARAIDAADESRIRELDIEFFRRHAARDPGGAADLARLAGLYLQRARETGSNEDLLRAEETTRHSLANRQSRNSRARVVLASALLAQHRFAEALGETRALTAIDPDRPSLRALRGELEMELGRYDEARATFQSLRRDAGSLAIAPRLARWAELEGHPDQAHHILVAARDEALKRVNLPAEQIAWFHLRVGDIALRYGRLREAEQALRAGLGAAPDDYRLLGGLCRLEAVRHRWRQAIEYGDRAIARALDPVTLGLVGDAYAGLGDTARAEEYYRTMEVSVRRQVGPFHRLEPLSSGPRPPRGRCRSEGGGGPHHASRHLRL